MRRGDVPRDLGAQRPLPPLANEQRTGAQLARRARERERLERASPRIVVEMDRAHD
jgi:hypothetical protein